ncbi:putative MAGE family [Paratrimastix pyriformis]|uniref:MAGE family n=1 Tax=Paratrimastix pyriformis TaxID=342808 RepID=A0ABQ8UGZ9_9EUKA|nr:putative MAGE family [Paratrimastix pyriformis]
MERSVITPVRTRQTGKTRVANDDNEEEGDEGSEVEDEPRDVDYLYRHKKLDLRDAETARGKVIAGDLMDQMAWQCCRLFFCKQFKGYPVRKAEITKFVVSAAGTKEFKSIRGTVDKVIDAANQKLEELCFRIAPLPEVKRLSKDITAVGTAASTASSGSNTAYIMISTLTPEERSLMPPPPKHIAAKRGFILMVLTILMLHNRPMPEDLLWQYMRRCGLQKEKSSPELGDVNALLNHDLVHEAYLMRDVIHTENGVQVSFRWGPRAHYEISALDLLKRVGKRFGDAEPRSTSYSLLSEYLEFESGATATHVAAEHLPIPRRGEPGLGATATAVAAAAEAAMEEDARSRKRAPAKKAILCIVSFRASQAKSPVHPIYAARRPRDQVGLTNRSELRHIFEIPHQHPVHSHLPTLEEAQNDEQLRLQHQTIQSYLLETSVNKNTSLGFQRLLPVSNSVSIRESMAARDPSPSRSPSPPAVNHSTTRTFTQELLHRTLRSSNANPIGVSMSRSFSPEQTLSATLSLPPAAMATMSGTLLPLIATRQSTVPTPGSRMPPIAPAPASFLATRARMPDKFARPQDLQATCLTTIGEEKRNFAPTVAGDFNPALLRSTSAEPRVSKERSSDELRAATAASPARDWVKPPKNPSFGPPSVLHAPPPPTRYGRTAFPDTRHITVPGEGAASFAEDRDRMRTTTRIPLQTSELDDRQIRQQRSEVRASRIRDHESRVLRSYAENEARAQLLADARIQAITRQKIAYLESIALREDQ